MQLPKGLGPSIILFLIVALNPTSPIGISSLHNVYATTRTISLVGFASSGWNSTPANPAITIVQGDTLVITTSRGDNFPHHFFVDVDGNGMIPNCTVDKCASIIPPTATDTLTGFTQGSYTYYCEYHSAMTGTFTVQPAPSTPDFTISPSQSSMSVAQGSSGTGTITLASQNGFAGNVNLTDTVSPSGPTVTFSPSTVALTSGGSGTSTLTVATSSGLYSSTSTGTYMIIVTGSGTSSLSHSTTISVTVTSSPSSPVPNNITAYVWVVGGIAIVTVAIVGAYAVLRRRPGKQA